MAKEYGFDHDAMVDISDADHAHRLARNLKQS